jgi:hypothetical protein
MRLTGIIVIYDKITGSKLPLNGTRATEVKIKLISLHTKVNFLSVQGLEGSGC